MKDRLPKTRTMPRAIKKYAPFSGNIMVKATKILVAAIAMTGERNKRGLTLL
jgi:hypothetical protein